MINNEQNIQEELGTEGLVSVVPGKPGLDVENGRYRILGGVTFGPIFTRSTTKADKKAEAEGKATGKVGAPFAKLAGVKVAEYHVDKDGNLLKDDEGNNIVKSVKIITKEEGVFLASKYGMQNAHIDSRIREDKDDKGTVVKKYPSIYLYPYPRQSEAFFKEDRAIVVYNLDSKGKVAIPVELKIKEEDCSAKFWRLLQQDYTKKKAKSENQRSQVQYEEKMSQLARVIDSNNIGIENPFA